MKQEILEANGEYSVLDAWFLANNIHRAMLVCGRSIERLSIHAYLEKLPERLGVQIIRFQDFQPNPLYANVVDGVKRFREQECDALIAVGGGSAMDVAKCIKLFSNMPREGKEGCFLRQTVCANTIPFLAMPTTSGTGSESTRFAVIYYQGNKQSVSDVSCIPQTVLMDSSVLKTLPLYQKKATMMDALCHAIESFWSVNSTEESKQYSRDAIRQILLHKDDYLANIDAGNAGMLYAANLAGKAINITQTTAGHAMCYKITSLFGCAHGHSAILCDRILYSHLVKHTANCADPRGKTYLEQTLNEIADAMGCENALQGAQKLSELFRQSGLQIPEARAEQFEQLKTSVNPVRLKNHPVALDLNEIDVLYHQILRETKNEG